MSSRILAASVSQGTKASHRSIRVIAGAGTAAPPRAAAMAKAAHLAFQHLAVGALAVGPGDGESGEITLAG